MLKKSIEDINETFFSESNCALYSASGKIDFDFSFQVLWMTKYEDFLKDYKNKKIGNNLFIESKGYSINDPDGMFFQRFEIWWVYIDSAQWFLNFIQHNLKIKDFLYIYYLFLFWNELYFYKEIEIDDWKMVIPPKISIMNKLYKSKELKNIDKYLVKEYPIKTIIENKQDNNSILFETLEWDTYDLYRIVKNMNSKKNIRFSPIKIWIIDNSEHNNIKKIFSKLLPNSEYDEKEEDDNESILKSWEIFNYFVATSKRKSQTPSNEKIKQEIFKLWKENNISDEEIERGISFVNNFLSSIL